MRGRTDQGGGVDRGARHDYWGVVLEAPDAGALADFYAGLLGWQVHSREPGFATIAPPDGVAYLGFQTSASYVRPVWPARPNSQAITMHLDFEVDDLTAAVGHARELGAELAGHQPQAGVRVLLDPAGHPFCLYVDQVT